jgi:hypothetical protein
MKLCPKCSTTKAHEDFYKCKKNKDGLQSYCKLCILAANKSWAKDNKEKFKAYSKKFTETEHRKAYLKEYKEQNKAAIQQKVKRYKKENADKIKESSRLYRENNLGACKETQRKYRLENKERVLQSSARYREKNKSKYARYRSHRRARERRAQPHWLSPEDILRMDLIWKLRELKSFVAGVDHEVDHIVPLNGKTVCGLHVPWNLRLITRTENRKKGALTWPNMW